MGAQQSRRIVERREAELHSGEGRRIDKARRLGDRRRGQGEGEGEGEGEELTDRENYDRRGAHPSLFATLGFSLLRGVRRLGLARRSDVVRRSDVRRRVDQ